MRPASRRALLERLARSAPRNRRTGWVAALLVAAVLGAAFLLRDSAQQQRAAAPQESGAPMIDAVMAPPFGAGSAKAPAAPAADTAANAVEALRSAYRKSSDHLALFREWRLRPEPEARYLAYRAARDCEFALAGGVLAELDVSERRGERERQMAIGAARCRGFLAEPAAPDELQRLLQETAAAGHPAAQIALATEAFVQGQPTQAIAVLRRALASADPLAFDEARVMLAMGRHQLVIAGVVPAPAVDGRRTDARVLAIDLAACRMGNPCGPGRGAVAIDCGDSAPCRRDAEEWVMQLSELDDDERRTALGLAERLVAAFKRGAVDEIVRVPNSSLPTQ